MRWKAAPLVVLLLAVPSLAFAADPVKSYPDSSSCMAAEGRPCSRRDDGTWVPQLNNGGSGGEITAPPDDPVLGEHQRRSASLNWSGEPDHPIVMVDMDMVTFPDAKPYLDHEINRVRVPIRFVAEAMGAKVDWEPVTQTVTIAREQLTIQLAIDKATAIVNGKEIQIDASPKLVEDRTMVPLRFISEAFGAKVDWVGTEEPVPDRPEWGHYQVWIWIPWGYWGTATIKERILVYSWWWHRDEGGH